MKNEKTILRIMFAGILLIVMTPFLFTHFGFGVDFTSSNTNNIGGTIGGITAPFTGTLGSILVYFALKEQVTANKLIQKQLDEQKQSDEESKVVTYLKHQLETIIKDIEEFSLSYERNKQVGNGKTEKTSGLITGSEAIFKYLSGYLQADTHHDLDYSNRFYQVKNIKYYISLINELVTSINSENIPAKDKSFLTSAIKYHYITKVKPQFDKFESNKTSNTEECKKCGIKHFGIPDELFDIIYSINRGLQL